MPARRSSGVASTSIGPKVSVSMRVFLIMGLESCGRSAISAVAEGSKPGGAGVLGWGRGIGCGKPKAATSRWVRIKRMSGQTQQFVELACWEYQSSR